MNYQGTGISVESGNSDADVTVCAENATIGVLLQQLRRHDLLDGENDSVFAADGDGRAGLVDGFGGVVDLENSAVGRELGCVEIVSGADGTHFRRLIDEKV
jgi:hypothetical protein